MTYGELNCSICGVHASVKPLYRNNEKGVAADWRCELDLEGKPDKVTKQVVDIIHKAKP